MTAGSSSGPSREAPTEVTCIPGSSDSAAKIGCPASVQAQTTSAPATASSNEAHAVPPTSSASARACSSAAARDAHLGELSHARCRVDVRARLHTCPEDGQHARVRPGERSRGDGRSRTGAHGRDLGPVHERERLARWCRRRARSSPGGWADRPRGFRRRPRRASSRGSRPRSRASPPAGPAPSRQRCGAGRTRGRR